MTLSKQQERSFDSTKIAFIKKYEIRGEKLSRDLRALLELREEQTMIFARQLALSIDGLTPAQITQIKDRFPNG